MTVVETGGFVNAQEELNVSQSTLSCHMAELEERLGMRLCERGRSGFRVTQDGEMVYQAAENLFLHIDEFNADILSRKGKLVGDLRIACMDHIIHEKRIRISDALARFKDRSGTVNINLHVKPPAEVEHGVVEGLYHVGIGTPMKQLTGLGYIPICKQEHQLFCAKSHPLFNKAGVEMSLSELSEWEMVMPKFRHAEVIPKPEEMSLCTLPLVTATGFNTEGIAMLVLSGKFLGVLPVAYAEQWVARGELRTLWSEKIKATVEISVIHKKQHTIQPLLKAFIDDMLHMHHMEDIRALA